MIEDFRCKITDLEKKNGLMMDEMKSKEEQLVNDLLISDLSSQDLLQKSNQLSLEEEISKLKKDQIEDDQVIQKLKSDLQKQVEEMEVLTQHV